MNSDNYFLTPENDFDKLSKKFNKNKLNVSFNRIAFIFFSFVLVLLVFSLKAFYLTGKDLPISNNLNAKKEIRSNILDRNNNILAKTLVTRNIGSRNTVPSVMKRLIALLWKP